MLILGIVAVVVVAVGVGVTFPSKLDLWALGLSPSALKNGVWLDALSLEPWVPSVFVDFRRCIRGPNYAIFDLIFRNIVLLCHIRHFFLAFKLHSRPSVCVSLIYMSITHMSTKIIIAIGATVQRT